eukprot:c17999_g1_i3.p1 GENE.c17999_g1_i3~~c17999_g1_i3.p1  ORF type:complete len:484 (+),score=86.70 c17999_g1_i3:26-1453(+)
MIRSLRAGASADYVILGAGSAGCVLANRLSEDAATKVTVLEAGFPDSGKWDSWKIHMPSALTYNVKTSKYNWDYWTEPQEHLDGRRLHQPRGKALGGSSSLNAMVYIRGHALDYERWQKVDGVEGWDYAHCLPYFKKAQSHMNGPDAYRGGDGPLEVTRNWYKNKLNDLFVKAGVEAGYAYTDDMNGERQEGFGPMDMTIGRDGRRCSASKAYLTPARRRPNVQVHTRCHIVRVLFDGKDRPRAIGVQYVDENGSLKTIQANKEVILSLGAFGSPQLLMLSGIGDPDHLREHGIQVVHPNSNVGQNLQDHLDTYVQFLADQPVSIYPYATFQKPWKPVLAALEWAMRGKGVCASNHFEVGGFVRSRAGMEHPDIQYHFIPACVVGQMDILPEHGFQVHCSPMRPLSTGFVKLRSNDPFQPLVIQPNYMSHQQDWVDLRNGLRLTLELVQQQAFDGVRGVRLNPTKDIDVNDGEEI